MSPISRFLLSALAAWGLGCSLESVAWGQVVELPAETLPPPAIVRPRMPAETSPPESASAPDAPAADSGPTADAGAVPGPAVTSPDPPARPRSEPPAATNLQRVSRPALGAVSAGLSAAPNMIGDTSAGSCGVLQFDGALSVASVAHPTFACSRVNIAENNSALLRDRVYVSVRHFRKASNISVFPSSPNGGTNALDLDRITLGLEKRWGDCSSLELRVPINVQLSSELSFSQTTALTPGGPPEVDLPLEDTETSIGNLTLISKHRLWASDRMSIAGGIALNLPTSPDVRLRGFVDDDDFIIEDNAGNPVGNADVDFFFDSLIENNLTTLSPFTAFLYAPNEDWFLQGFLQLDFPVRPLFGTLRGQLRSPFSLPEFSDRGDIEVQQLARFSLGCGRSLYRCDRARYLRKLTLTSELHYTTTLEDAELARVEILPAIGFVPETTVRVGNLSNRTDILNQVTGLHAQVAKTTFTLGCATPLRGGDDRGFDYEITAMVNRSF